MGNKISSPIFVHGCQIRKKVSVYGVWDKTFFMCLKCIGQLSSTAFKSCKKKSQNLTSKNGTFQLKNLATMSNKSKARLRCEFICEYHARAYIHLYFYIHWYYNRPYRMINTRYDEP